MTGLDLARDALIEIACIVTDGQLNAARRGRGSGDQAARRGAGPDGAEVVREMHTASGLLDRARVRDHPGRGAGAGAGVRAQPRAPSRGRCRCAATRSPPTASFIARDMPELDAFLHYRMVDVSSIKELARRWYPRAYFASPQKHGGHRALADIRESIQELRYYREAIFVPQPGPDSATAREIASKYGDRPARQRACRRPPGPAARPATRRVTGYPVRRRPGAPLCFMQPYGDGGRSSVG